MEQDHDSAPSFDCCDWRHTVEDLNDRAREFVREEPSKAIGWALVGGVLLAVLPVGRILAALLRLALPLFMPLALLLAALKLCERATEGQEPVS